MKKTDIASTAPRVAAGDPTDWNLPDLNLLKVFEAIYDEGGAGRAARLGVTQSAVSAALARLRALYGDPLFTRTGRGLAPSLRARELRPVIGEALDKCRQSLALARPGRAGVAGRSVTLGLSDDFEIALGRDIMDRLAAEAPGLRVIFRQAHSRMAADMLMAREADLVIASGGLSAAALQKALVGHGGYACLLDPASLRRGQKALSVEEFVRREHVLVSSGGFIGVVDEVLHGMGLKRRVQASTSHFPRWPSCCAAARRWLRCPSMPRAAWRGRQAWRCCRVPSPCRAMPSSWVGAPMPCAIRPRLRCGDVCSRCWSSISGAPCPFERGCAPVASVKKTASASSRRCRSWTCAAEGQAKMNTRIEACVEFRSVELPCALLNIRIED